METQEIFKECYKEVEELLKKEKILLDRFANELLEKEAAYHCFCTSEDLEKMRTEQKGNGFGPAIQNIPESFEGVLLIALRKSLIAYLDQFLNEHYPIISKWQRNLILIDKREDC